MTYFNGKEINFDSSDWKGMRELCEKSNEFKLPLFGENEYGENIIISINSDNITVQTMQSNDWIRTNIYWVNDCIVEELYEK